MRADIEDEKMMINMRTQRVQKKMKGEYKKIMTQLLKEYESISLKNTGMALWSLWEPVWPY